MAMSPRLLRPIASGFNPKSIAGLVGWWDASDSSTLTIDTGVSVWADKSGSGNDGTQSVGNDQPLLGTLAGRQALSFDGGGKSINLPFGAFSTAETILTVWKTTGFSQILGDGNIRLYNDSSNARLVYAYNTFNAGERFAIGGGHNPNVRVVMATRVGPSAGRAWLYRDSDNLRLATASLTTRSLGLTKSNMGNGALGEVLHYRAELSDSEVEKVLQYLLKKWPA